MVYCISSISSGPSIIPNAKFQIMPNISAVIVLLIAFKSLIGDLIASIGGYLFLAFDLRHDHAFVIDLVQVLLIIGAGCSLYYEFTTSMTIVGLGQSENGLCLIGAMLLPLSHSFAL